LTAGKIKIMREKGHLVLIGGAEERSGEMVRKGSYEK